MTLQKQNRSMPTTKRTRTDPGFRRSPLMLITTVIAAGLPGCTAQHDPIPDQSSNLVVPEMFYEADLAWTKAAGLSKRDIHRLTVYFEANPSVAEHSIVQGDPLAYADHRRRLRYYWVRPGRDGAEWLCLEFGRKGISLTEGHGKPFLGG